MDRHDLLQLKQPRPSGFTLVEMAVVLALSAVLLTTFYSFVAEEMVNAADESSEIGVQTNIRSPMTQMVEVLEGSRLFALDSFANWVCYQIPQTGPSGTPVLGADMNNNPVLVMGALPFDGSAFQVGGYYQIVFKNHFATLANGQIAQDTIFENLTTNPKNPSGQNISGTYASFYVKGSTNFTVSYDKGFQRGHFEIECHAAPPNATVLMSGDFNYLTTGNPEPGPGGQIVGPNRVLSGTVMRQVDPTDGGVPALVAGVVTNNVNIKRTFPWSGFFYMKNPGTGAVPAQNPVYNVSGGISGSLTWQAQTADSLTVSSNETNGYGLIDDGSAKTDFDGTGVFDVRDCDGFVDLDKNNVFNGNDYLASSGSSSASSGASWSGSLRIQFYAFDAQKLVTNSSRASNSFAAVRTVSTKVKITN